MQAVTNDKGQKGFYDETSGFISAESLQKVTNPEGQRGYYSEQTGFIPAPDQGSPQAPGKWKNAEQEGHGFLGGINESIVKRGVNIADTLDSKGNESIGQTFKNLPNRALQVTGQAAGLMGDVLGQGIKSAYQTVMPEGKQKEISEGVSSAGKKISESKDPLTRLGLSAAKRGMAEWQLFKKSYPDTAKDIEAVINIASIVPITKGAKVATQATGAALHAAGPAIDAASPAIIKGTEKVIDKAAKAKDWMVGTPNKTEALGQILQGKPEQIAKDYAKGERALGLINTEVKDTPELLNRLNMKIPELAKKVDAELMKDTKAYSFDELSTAQKIKPFREAVAPAAEAVKPKTWKAVPSPHGGGWAVIDEAGNYEKGAQGHPAFYSKEETAKVSAEYNMAKLAKEKASPVGTGFKEPTEVKVNYVKDALENLEELYNQIGDKAKAIDTKNILRKAKTTGLTRKEVNDIAREYNAEFGSKGFNKQQVPLTSVSAQKFQNVQSGLKEVARRGLSDTAKELDADLSAIYNTKRLVSKNLVELNKLKQRVNPRGITEKTGRLIFDIADAATLGVAKAALHKLVPRGSGYKVMNAIDREELLARNLRILRRANAAKTPAEATQIIQQGFKK